MSAPAEQLCGCKHSDAWRCAVARVLPTVSCHCSCHRRAVEQSTAPSDREAKAQVVNSIDFSNRHMLSAGVGGRAYAFLNPPNRAQTMTPEECLVLAAWLVAMAEPFSQISFTDVLDQVTGH